MLPSIEPQAAVKLTDTLLSCFYEVERLNATLPYDVTRIALLVAGAREAIENEVKFDYAVRASENETSLSRIWINMLMVQDIRLLSALKARLLTPSPDQEEEKPIRFFLCILVDVCSLLASPTLREPLDEYFKGHAAESPGKTAP